MSKELWKSIPEYEGYYEISNVGRVRRLFRGVRNLHRHSRLLKTNCLTNSGYRQACLSKNNVQSYRYVHALVAEAFVGPRPNGHVINHKDLNRINNCYDNLEYVTQQENTDHAIANGHVSPKGEHHKNAKLNWAIVRLIRRLNGSLSGREMAKIWNVTPSVISRILNNNLWKITEGNPEA